MYKIIAIAKNTFKEAMRNKVLYTIVAFAIIMIGSSFFLAELTVGANVKVMKDMGLAFISIFGIFISIFIGIGLVYREIDKRTIFTIISKPIARYEFIIGKYFGLLLTLAIQLFVMLIFFYCVELYVEKTIDIYIMLGIFTIFLELMIVTAFSIFFSSFTTPFLSGLFTISLFVIGHLTEDLLALGEKSKKIFIVSISKVVYFIIPNLENFNIKNRLVHHLPISYSEIAYITTYGLFWISFLLFFSILIFQRRDFK